MSTTTTNNTRTAAEFERLTSALIAIEVELAPVALALIAERCTDLAGRPVEAITFDWFYDGAVAPVLVVGSLTIDDEVHTYGDLLHAVQVDNDIWRALSLLSTLLEELPGPITA
jgi:hypothetical protein